MAKLTKLERQIMEKFMALHRFRVAKTEEERQAAIKYAQEYCAKYKLNYKREFSHLYWATSILYSFYTSISTLLNTNTLSLTNTLTYLPIANIFDATFNSRLILVITLWKQTGNIYGRFYY